LEEAREQVELLARQLDRLAADRDLVRVAPEDDVPCGQHLLLRALLRPAQDRLDPRGQLTRREGLRDVVVGAELEPGDAVGLLVAGSRRQTSNPSIPGSPTSSTTRRTGCRRSSPTASSPLRSHSTRQPSCCSRYCLTSLPIASSSSTSMRTLPWASPNPRPDPRPESAGRACSPGGGRAHASGVAAGRRRRRRGRSPSS